MLGPYRLRRLTPDDLELVRAWRNRPEVRGHMFSRHEIDADEHRAFFESALHDPTRRFWLGLDPTGTPVGVVSLKDIDRPHGTASWGIYNGDAAPKGTGTWLGSLALTAAFDDLHLSTVYAEVLEANTRSLRFHHMLGFVLEAVFSGRRVGDDRDVQVHRFAMTVDAWREHRHVVAGRLHASAHVCDRGAQDGAAPNRAPHDQTGPLAQEDA